LWDRRRGFIQTTSGDDVVLLDVGTRRGLVTRRGTSIGGSEAAALIQDAYGWFCNDTFWLNPLAKLFDEGVTRSIVRTPEGDALLVSYASGGVTPGDAYLWFARDDALPHRFSMWVSVLPIGGVGATWEGWIELATGAWVATRHAIGPIEFEVSDVAGAPDLATLIGPGPDPFAALAGN
jgi:hypothetical protein